MLGMGPLIWNQIKPRNWTDAPAERYFSKFKGTWPWTARYYRAIDAINRGDRELCASRGHDRCSINMGVRREPFP